MQQRSFVGHQHQQQAGRINAQFHQSAHVDMSRPLLHRFGAQPQDRPPFSCKQAQQRSHTRATARIILIGEQFMQPPAREPAAQYRIDMIMAQRKQRRRRSRTTRFQLLQAFP